MEQFNAVLADGSLVSTAMDAGKAIVIFIVGWIVSKWVARAVVKAVTRRNFDPMLGRFIGSLAQWTVLGAAAIAALGAVGIETTSLVAVFASAGVAVGLALQGSLSNFASGVLLLVFRPFQIDDVITASGETGKVHEIGLFATILISPDNQKIIIPNAAVTGGTITNITTLGTRRVAVDIGVAYGTNTSNLADLLIPIAKACPSSIDEPEPALAFVGMGASSIDFKLMAWCKSSDAIALGHEMRTAAYNALNEAGIDIPYPQMVMHKAE